MLAKEIARAFGRPWPAVQYELKQSVALALENPEVAALFDHWPTPDEYFKKQNKYKSKKGRPVMGRPLSISGPKVVHKWGATVPHKF